jgi:hypothetical protein
MQADPKSVLWHPGVRLLSWGKILKRLVELKLRRFLQNSGSPLYQHFLGKKLLAILSYLSDIFDKLDGLNFFRQGSNAQVFQVFDKVLTFMKENATEKPL